MSLPLHFPRVACLMMQKDENDLISPWIRYYSFLFGSENIFVWDNGSTKESVISTLREAQENGANVFWESNTPTDFRRKGIILGDKIKQLDEDGKYDFYFPLDCDEFLTVEVVPGALTSDRRMIADVLRYFMSADQVLGVNYAYFNVLGHPGYYWRWKHRKSVFRAKTFKKMDHGYHEGESILPGERINIPIVYMHYYHKPHSVIVEHSLNKMKPYVDTNEENLKAIYNTNRLAKLAVDDEQTYMTKFTTERALYVPYFPSFLGSIGLPNPFDHTS